MSEARFRAVEDALKALADRLVEQGEAAEATIGEKFTAVKYPRVFVVFKRGEAREEKVGQAGQRHTWVFDLVVDCVSTDPYSAYAKARRLAWLLYDMVMADRTLGGAASNARPSSLERGRMGTATEVGERWALSVEVSAEV